MAKTKRFIDTEDFRSVMDRLVGVLQFTPWCMIGGRAVEVWTNPPQTPDIDILAEVSPRSIRKIEDAMKAYKFALDRRFGGSGMAPMWFFKDTITGTEVDIIGAYESVHVWAIERSVQHKIKDGPKIMVAQAEDVIVLKANAACSPGRGVKAEHDIEAIKAIAENKKNNIDADYIVTVLLMASTSADWDDEAKLLHKLGVI